MKAPEVVTEPPPGLLTVTLTVPALPGGVVACIWLELLTVAALDVALPKFTEAPAAKFVPLIVTTVPPAVVPDVGDRLVIVGAGGGCAAM